MEARVACRRVETVHDHTDPQGTQPLPREVQPGGPCLPPQRSLALWHPRLPFPHQRVQKSSEHRGLASRPGRCEMVSKDT